MSGIFLKILNMSIAAGWMILAVVLMRGILRKAPKWTICLLWAIVAVRLILPFSFESRFSLVPSAETIPQNITEQQEPAINTGISIINEAINPIIADNFAPTKPTDTQSKDSVKQDVPEMPASQIHTESPAPAVPEGPKKADVPTIINPLQRVLKTASVIWLAGVIAMLIYALISYLRIRKTVAMSVPAGDRYEEILPAGIRIRAGDEVKSPFILGIIRPVVYVPFAVDGESLNYVLQHEAAHLKRRDHWWKPLGFLLLAVYWFNPLCWLAYILLCRDIEVACDEKVIRDMDKYSKAAYSNALLNCNYSRQKIAVCPLAFGEVGVKQRIKGILNYKKPAFWSILIALIACLVVTVCLLTDPVSGSGREVSEADSSGEDSDVISHKDEIRYAETVDELEEAAGHKINNIENFTVTAASVSADSCDLTYSNQTERLYDAGAEFWLYAKDVESGWYRLPYKESDIPLAFPMSAYLVAPGKERTDHYSIEAYYGTLPDGEYCMVVSVLPERDDDRYPEEKDTNIVELKTYFTVYFTIPAENQTAEMAEWNAYLASMADKAELFTSVDFVTIYDEPLSRTLYQYTTEEGETFTFTDQKELRAFTVENWQEDIPDDLPILVKTAQDAVDAFIEQYGMVIPNPEQYKIARYDDAADFKMWEVILARKRGEYLQDEINIKVRKDGKVVGFILSMPKIGNYSEEQYTRDYNEAVEAIKNRYSNRNLERCELTDLRFDTYDNGICAATYTFYCSTSQFMKGTKYEAAFAEECRIIVRP
jgi:beta-lactamase regulating signal transducer with metallopeptidase domain